MSVLNLDARRKIRRLLEEKVPPLLWGRCENAFNWLISTFPWLVYKKMKIDGLRIKYRLFTADEYIINELVEEDEYGLYSGRLQIARDDVIIDIGAQIGLFSIICAKRACRGKVYSFEPVRQNYNLLRANIRLNGLDNVYHFNLGVFGEGKKIRLSLSRQNTGGHSCVTRRSARYVEIDCLSLSDIFRRHEIAKCNLLKIDCEGAEYSIIFNTPEHCFERIERMIIEYHNFPDSKNHVRELTAFLQKHHYTVKQKEYDAITGVLYVDRKE